MKTTLLSIFTITLFSGCANHSVANLNFINDIKNMLHMEQPLQKCVYPKLPVYKVPHMHKVPKGMSIEEAFKKQNRVNAQLRFICRKYRRVAIETNRRYQN